MNVPMNIENNTNTIPLPVTNTNINININKKRGRENDEVLGGIFGKAPKITTTANDGMFWCMF